MRDMGVSPLLLVCDGPASSSPPPPAAAEAFTSTVCPHTAHSPATTVGWEHFSMYPLTLSSLQPVGAPTLKIPSMGATKGTVCGLADSVILDVCTLLPGGGRSSAFKLAVAESPVEDDVTSLGALAEFGDCGGAAAPVGTATGFRFRVGLLCDGCCALASDDGAPAGPSRATSVVGACESPDTESLRTSKAKVSPFRTALPEFAFQHETTKSPSGNRMTSYEGGGCFVSYPPLYPSFPS